MKFNSRVLVLSSIIVSCAYCAEGRMPGGLNPFLQQKAASVPTAERESFYAERFTFPGEILDVNGVLQRTLEDNGVPLESARIFAFAYAGISVTLGDFFSRLPHGFADVIGGDIAQAAVKRKETKLRWATIFLDQQQVARYRRISGQEMGQYPTRSHGNE